MDIRIKNTAICLISQEINGYIVRDVAHCAKIRLIKGGKGGARTAAGGKAYTRRPINNRQGDDSTRTEQGHVFNARRTVCIVLGVQTGAGTEKSAQKHSANVQASAAVAAGMIDSCGRTA